MTIRVALALFAAGLAIGACDLAPDVGPAYAPRCANVDGDPARRVAFAADVRPILVRVCATCHFPGGDNAIGLQRGGLDLSSYDTLMAGGVRSAGTLVVPGQPCDSILVQKVSPGPPFGSRMPLSGPPFLSDDERAVLHDWIAEGARAD